MTVQLIEQTFHQCWALGSHLGGGMRAMWRPNSDRSDRNADRTSPDKQRCEHRASTDGLQCLWPLLVAT